MCQVTPSARHSGATRSTLKLSRLNHAITSWYPFGHEMCTSSTMRMFCEKTTSCLIAALNVQCVRSKCASTAAATRISTPSATRPVGKLGQSLHASLLVLKWSAAHALQPYSGLA